MLFSVIICTRNPRLDYLKRVLEALRLQTLDRAQWEILLIDNASACPFDVEADLQWHGHHIVLREHRQGKAFALCRGISEAKGQLVVVVDDDNVLAPDYLEQAAKIYVDWPMLGAWSGKIIPDFETAPSAWAEPYLRYLAIRDVSQDQWSNLSDPAHYASLPWGAGMVIRREVALQWVEKTNRKGSWTQFERLGSGCGTEDTDMALMACDLGFGTGLFKDLKLTHLIRRERIEEQYLLRLVEGMMYSLRILAASRGHGISAESLGRVLWGHIRALGRGSREFRFYRASSRGINRARVDWERMSANEVVARSTESTVPKTGMTAPKTVRS